MELATLAAKRPALRHKHALPHPTERRHASARLLQMPRRPEPALVADDVANGQALKVRLVPSPSAVEREAVEVDGRRALHVVFLHAGQHRRAVLEHGPKVAQGEVLGLRVGGLKQERRAGSVFRDPAGQQSGEQRFARLDAGKYGQQLNLGVGRNPQRVPYPRRPVGPERPGHRRVRYGPHVRLEPSDDVALARRPEHVTTKPDQISPPHGSNPPASCVPKPPAPSRL